MSKQRITRQREPIARDARWTSGEQTVARSRSGERLAASCVLDL